MHIRIYKMLLLISTLLLSYGDLFAQVNWTKYTGNPVFTGKPGTWYAYISMSSTLYNADSSRYEMWFTCGAQAEFPYKIGYAWSYDGISWNVYDSNPVLAPTPGEWDAYCILDPFVLRENGQYKMWYAGIATTALLTRVGYATSPDGINWTKHPSNPVLLPGTASWESAAVSHGSVMPYSNGYKMWYSGSSAGGQKQTAIGYAVSPDGINWQKDTLINPVLLSGATGEWDRIVYGPEILYIDNLYYMFYTGEIVLYQSDKVGLATSTDGLVWTKYQSNPVLRPTSGQWDGSRTILSSVHMDADTINMYYAGSNGSNWKIGLAKSHYTLVGIEEEETIPTKFALIQNYPNPFNPGTKISWQVSVGSHQSITVFDVLGNEVATLVDEYKPAGRYEVEFNAASLPSGIYFYRLQSGSFIETKKMTFVK